MIQKIQENEMMVKRMKQKFSFRTRKFKKCRGKAIGLD